MDIIGRSKVIRIAFTGEEYPYVLPFNFGYEEKDGRMYFYIHTATEGKKNRLLEENNKVAFELDVYKRQVRRQACLTDLK